MANNRICLTCGTSYEYCGACPSGLNSPTWKSLFDEENCKNVFEIVSDYAQKTILKESANEKLLKCDLSNKDKFKKNIQSLISEIIEKNDIEKKPVFTGKKIVKRQTVTDEIKDSD